MPRNRRAGVLAVITGADIEATGGNFLPCGIPMENRDGSKGKNKLRPVLCTERVRHVGDNVAFVVAETLSQAKDAAELVAVDYEFLDVVADTETRGRPGRPLVHDDVPRQPELRLGVRRPLPRSRRPSPRQPTSPGCG